MQSFEQFTNTVLAETKSLCNKKQPSLLDLRSALSNISEQAGSDPHLFTSLPYDDAHAYSRSLLHDSELLEVMIARWTSEKPCAPHDHSDSQSAILILEGCAEHKRFQLEANELRCVHTEECVVGDIILCAPHQIHSMSAQPNLITLHFYTRSITDMLVFDVIHRSSFLIDGSCGAWLPVDDPSKIIASAKGHVSRDFFERAYS